MSESRLLGTCNEVSDLERFKNKIKKENNLSQDFLKKKLLASIGSLYSALPLPDLCLLRQRSILS